MQQPDFATIAQGSSVYATPWTIDNWNSYKNKYMNEENHDQEFLETAKLGPPPTSAPKQVAPRANVAPTPNTTRPNLPLPDAGIPQKPQQPLQRQQPTTNAVYQPNNKSDTPSLHIESNLECRYQSNLISTLHYKQKCIIQNQQIILVPPNQ